MKAIQPDVLDQIAKQVERGAGFLMIGGYSSFGDGDWKGTPVEPMLPVDLSVRGQVEGGPGGIKMVPTDEGLRLYSHVLRHRRRRRQGGASGVGEVARSGRRQSAGPADPQGQ